MAGWSFRVHNPVYTFPPSGGPPQKFGHLRRVLLMFRHWFQVSGFRMSNQPVEGPAHVPENVRSERTRAINDFRPRQYACNHIGMAADIRFAEYEADPRLVSAGLLPGTHISIIDHNGHRTIEASDSGQPPSRTFRSMSALVGWPVSRVNHPEPIRPATGIDHFAVPFLPARMERNGR